MAFISMVFVVIALLILLAVIGVLIGGLVGIGFLISGLIEGHENKKSVEAGRKSSDVHIGLKVAGVLLLLPAVALVVVIAIVGIKWGVREYKYTPNIKNVILNDNAAALSDLLKKGSSPNSYNYDNTYNTPAPEGYPTVIYELCQNKNIKEADKKLQILIDGGADPNWRVGKSYCEYTEAEHKTLDYNDRCGRTPLLSAAQACNTEAIKILLSCGVDINAVDYCGETALIYAVTSDESEKEIYDTVELLLNNGADKTIASNLSGTPAEAAHEKGLYSVEELLK